MSAKKKHPIDEQQLPLDFEAVMQGATVRSKEDYAPAEPYDPIGQTANYMQRAVEFEAAWETTIRTAREKLLNVNACELYLDFLKDMARRVREGEPQAVRYAELIKRVAIQGFGMGNDQIRVTPPTRGGVAWRVELNEASVRDHLERHIVGPNFLNVVQADDSLWEGRSPVIGASDVSQHVSQIPIPARFFKRTVPFVLNNAAGTLFVIKDGKATYENVFNPRPDEQLLRWMLIDPSYQAELDDEDYRRCLGSSMDVGQYNFDFEYLLNADKRTPDVILRDGSLFPQDAKLTNFAIDSKRGDFTREAIRKLLSCLSLAQQYYGVIYCGIAKRVNLKVYSAPVEWFIQREIDPNWEVGSYTLTDGEAMSVLLPSPDFTAEKLGSVVGTCLIRRSFTTRATLNIDPGLPNLDRRLTEFQRQHQDVDLRPYRRLCEMGHFYMFFLGHSRSPQQQLPRYEFFDGGRLPPAANAAAILAALRLCSLITDNDHSFMTETPVTYLLPNVTQQAHYLSKQVGSQIDRATGQWIMARYRSRLGS
jgi:hypothetical protein